ncbi:MAG: CoA-binding protein [Clostridia bacterium]|nr:CoA-binding protein [Clostridia bacterium]
MPERYLDKKVWAVVGATQDETKFGYKIYKKIKECGYTVYPLSIKYNDIDGDRAYKNLEELPEKPDVVNLVVNPEVGMNTLKCMKKLSIKRVWMQPGTDSDELLKYAKDNDIEVIQACVLVAMCVYRTDKCCI